MKIFYFLFSILIPFGFYSCEDDLLESKKRITGTGQIGSKSLVVNDFTSIDLENVSNVYIETGKDRKIVFTAYENILPYMTAYVVGDELLLKFSEDITVNSDEELRVEITVPELEKVTLSGVGNISLEGPSQVAFEVDLDGVGNVNAFNLPVLEGIVNIDGNGNVEINAKDELEVDIDGLGNVFYQGNPMLQVEIDGLGEVIKN